MPQELGPGPGSQHKMGFVPSQSLTHAHRKPAPVSWNQGRGYMALGMGGGLARNADPQAEWDTLMAQGAGRDDGPQVRKAMVREQPKGTKDSQTLERTWRKRGGAMQGWGTLRQ